jgi:hypothetical protein
MRKKITSIFNYAIVRSIFGDYWVGKTLLVADEKAIFSKVEDAVNKAQHLFCENNLNFDPNAEEGDAEYNDELYSIWDNIRFDAIESGEIKEIRVTIQDRIVRQ